MRVDKVSLSETRAFSPFFIDYIEGQEKLRSFYDRFPHIENFEGQIKEKQKSFSAEYRKTLVNTLRQQYTGIKTNEAVSRNIDALESDNTFTITTGHQLNIFTGPLYFIFKIVTVVNACKELKLQYPDCNFVPVYWMASEDHDYDEIKYFRLYGKKYVWDTQQSGAVGRFSTKGLDKLANELPGNNAIFKTAYTKQKTLAAAVRHYVNELFGSDGLIVIDADDKSLKTEFSAVIREDVIKQSVKPIVDKTNRELEALGYKTQVFCRDINFFLLGDNARHRVEKSDKTFTIVDTDQQYSADQIETLISSYPERFSPNVILRPLYQEQILPNLAYVGGPAEVIYWLQLRQVFRHFNTPFPVLMPRNFGMVIEHEVLRKFEKTGLKLTDFFHDKNYLFNHWVLSNTSHNISTTKELREADRIFSKLQQQAGAIDPTLSAYVGAAHKRTSSYLEKIEKKMLRAEKRFHSDKLRQIEAVKDALYPGGGLQERVDNFLNFYHRDPQFIDVLRDHFEPFDFSFNILSYTG